MLVILDCLLCCLYEVYIIYIYLYILKKNLIYSLSEHVCDVLSILCIEMLYQLHFSLTVGKDSVNLIELVLLLL